MINLRKFLIPILFVFLLLPSVFSIDINQVPTTSSYDTSIFSNFLALSAYDDGDLFPYYVGTTGNNVFKPNHGIYHKTTTFQLVKNHLQHMNPPNNANGKYEASFIKVYRITPEGKSILEKEYNIDPHRITLLATDQVYRIDIYNYDFCTYMDKNPSYDPTDLKKADECRFQGGTKHNAAQERIFKEQQNQQENIKKWLVDSYDSDSLKGPLKEYELELENLKAHYESCLSAWYMPYPFCLSIKKHYDEQVSEYNSYVKMANNREAITRKSFDSNLENLKSQLKVFETKSNYYKDLDKVQNDEKFKEKVANGDYDSDFSFVDENLDLIEQSLRKTVIDIEDSKIPEGEFLSYTYDEDIPKESKSKTITFLVTFFLLASLIFVFNKVPFMRRYKSWGYALGTIVIIVLIIL